jgi:hypothetical protein
LKEIKCTTSFRSSNSLKKKKNRKCNKIRKLKAKQRRLIVRSSFKWMELPFTSKNLTASSWSTTNARWVSLTRRAGSEEKSFG